MHCSSPKRWAATSPGAELARRSGGRGAGSMQVAVPVEVIVPGPTPRSSRPWSAPSRCRRRRRDRGCPCVRRSGSRAGPPSHLRTGRRSSRPDRGDRAFPLPPPAPPCRGPGSRSLRARYPNVDRVAGLVRLGRHRLQAPVERGGERAQVVFAVLIPGKCAHVGEATLLGLMSHGAEALVRPQAARAGGGGGSLRRRT